jgi:hypothetical protein
MTKAKKEQPTPANTEIERELEKLTLSVLRAANTPGVPLEEQIAALKTGTDAYAKLRKLPPSGDERKGGFDEFRKQAAGGGAGGGAGLTALGPGGIRSAVVVS